MTRTEAWLQHASNLLVGGTGVVYGWMLYFAEPADEFALVNHPAQPLMHHAHVLTAPVLVFAAAMIWQRHVWARVRSGYRQRRSSGLVLAATLFPMIASGYLVQTSVSDLWRQVWLVVHLVASGLWLAAYALHQLSARPRVTAP